MTVEDFNNALLALACWQEMKDTSVDTMLCIAHTIVNLAKLQNIGIGQAILDHRTLHGVETDDTLTPDEREPRFSKLLSRIDYVDSQYGEDITNGAIYYLDLSCPVPESMAFILKDPEAHPLCAVKGNLHFFK